MSYLNIEEEKSTGKNRFRKIVFVCIGNSCRSQISEGWANYFNKQNFNNEFIIYSAGTYPAGWVSEGAVESMKEVGIDISNQYSKHLEEIQTKETDLLVTLGCGAECPWYPHKKMVEWEIEDPVGEPIEKFREVRDILKEKIFNLMSEYY
jgi:arsenate reductase